MPTDKRRQNWAAGLALENNFLEGYIKFRTVTPVTATYVMFIHLCLYRIVFIYIFIDLKYTTVTVIAGSYSLLTWFVHKKTEFCLDDFDLFKYLKKK